MKVLFGNCDFSLTDKILEFQRRFPGVEFVYFPEKKDIDKAIVDADVYMGYLGRETFLKAKKLKWVQAASSGVNGYLAIPELATGDVLLTSASGTHADPVADSTMAMILAHTRGIAQAYLLQQEHKYDDSIRARLTVLKGSTMGIIGLGNIGRAVAERARGFGMRIIAVDMGRKNADVVDELWGMSRMDDLLEESDYVVVMVPYTKETANFIGAREIGLMKKSAMLVVMSRGGIVDEAALIRALREGKLGSAVMDVTNEEPLPPESELWDTRNLIVAAHISGGTPFESKIMLDIFAENLGRFIKGESPLRNQIDKVKQF